MKRICLNIFLERLKLRVPLILMQHLCNERSDWLDVKSFRHTNTRYTVANKMTSWENHERRFENAVKMHFSWVALEWG